MVNYEVVKFLGKGAFGKVHLVRDLSDPKRLFAMKEIENNTRRVRQEVQLLSELNHRHILSLKNHFVKNGKMYIITEYCPNGDLQKFVNNQRGTLVDKSKVITWFSQITDAIKYLHNRNVIHRDLKLDNILLDDVNNCKLGDFGVSRILRGKHDMALTQAGAICHMSPEQLNGRRYNEKTDIWSLGLTIYELATLDKAFNKEKDLLLQKLSMPSRYSPAFRDLMLSMLKENPDDRPSAAEILQSLRHIDATPAVNVQAVRHMRRPGTIRRSHSPSQIQIRLRKIEEIEFHQDAHGPVKLPPIVKHPMIPAKPIRQPCAHPRLPIIQPVIQPVAQQQIIPACSFVQQQFIPQQAVTQQFVQQQWLPQPPVMQPFVQQQWLPQPPVMQPFVQQQWLPPPPVMQPFVQQQWLPPQPVMQPFVQQQFLPPQPVMQPGMQCFNFQPF